MFVANLLNQNEAGIMIKVMPWEAKVFIERLGFRAVDIAAMGVESFIRWWFRFTYILLERAFQAIPEVDDVFTPAIEIVPYVESFFGVVAGEGLGGSKLATAFILHQAQAWGATHYFRGFLR